jgi:hypothetical protein
MDDLDVRLRERMGGLEASLPAVLAAMDGQKRTRHGARLVSSVLAVAFAVSFGSGVAAGAVVRELIPDPGWTDSGLFTKGGALYCSGLHGMAPVEAAHILEQLGYEVTWQVDDRATGTSHQTTEVPTDGYVDEGIQKGRELVIVVPQHDDEPHSNDPCQS